VDELAQGGQIDGRFELQGTLGRGGMGVVYRAIDRERGVEVALKTLRGVSPQRVLRFKSEFRALRDLRHPNLVELGELFESEGTWFFTMELVRGRPFLDWVAATSVDVDTGPTSANGPLTAQESSPSLVVTTADAPASVVARNIARGSRRRVERRPGPACDVAKLRYALAGLVRGLAALHGAQKVHRDIKPSNILVEDSGRLVLLDFGVVAELHDRFQEGLLFGTARYMAPEQARGDAIGPAADWYAVGVLTFEALTGELPFAEASNDELLVLKQHVDAPAPSELVDGVPPELDALVRGLLGRDPEHRPTAASLLDVLGVDLDDEPLPPLGGGAGDVFVGRAAELAQLDAALAASRHATAHVVIEGESGVGKSALVARFVELARAREPRLLVLRGRCHERERVPFNALDGVLDDLARYLATRREATIERILPDGVNALLAVFPALRAAKRLVAAALVDSNEDDTDVRGRAFGALRELLARLARRRPVAIVLDDMQWADADSSALLAELLRGAPPLCVVETRRPVAGLPVAARAQHIELGGLDTRDAEELVRQIGAPDAAYIVNESRGHPLFLRELARHGAAGVAASLEHVIWSRVARLDAAARRLLAVIAVAGSPLQRQIACEAAGLTVADGDPQLAALAAEHLVRAHGPRPHDAVEAFHDRVRGAVCAHVPAGEQRELHARIARSLEVTGASAAALLAHFEAAGDHDRVSRYLIAAADDARAAFAFGQVATLLRRALADATLAPDRRCELMVALADALANDGRTAEAARCYLEAAALVPPDSEQHLDLLRRAAERFLMSGEVADGLATARAVLARVAMRLPASRARVIAGILWNQLRMRGTAFHWTPRKTTDPRSVDADVCWSLGAGLGMIDSLLGAYFSGRAARLALAHGTPLQITRCMTAAMIGAALLGRRERTHRLLDAAVRAAGEDGTPLAQWYVGLARTGREFILENQFRRAYESARSLEAEWYAAGQGPGWETDVAMHFSIASQQMLGDYRDMARRVARHVERAHRKGDLFQEVTLRVRFAVRHLLEDRADVARSDVLDALAAWLPGSDSFGNQRAWALWSRTRIELYANRLATLDDELGAEWQRHARSLVGRIPLMQTEYLHAYGTFLLGRAIAARSAGRPSEHAALCRAADRVANRLARLDFPGAPCAEWLVRAAIAWVRRDGDVIDVTRRALDEAHRTGVLAYAHATERRLGEAIGGDEGAALVARADAAMRAAGWRDPERAAEMAIPSGRFAE